MGEMGRKNETMCICKTNLSREKLKACNIYVNTYNIYSDICYKRIGSWQVCEYTILMVLLHVLFQV